MDIVQYAVSFLESSKYFLLFAGCFTEGSVVMMTGGLLWHSGVMEFWPAYGALLLGDVLSDTMWYVIGYSGARRFAERWGRYVNVTPAIIEKAESKFNRHHTSILIISKLTMGFGFAIATLITAGMLKVPFARYFTINFLGGLIWIYGLMLIGYYFGDIVFLVPKELQIAVAVAGIIAFFYFLKFISAHLAKKEW
ncbi:MAG: DedA family protein [Candidatus Kaiserbacteria bacterium]|nr:DedA family protein [Candidatus Kaiserbacteria bacterium]